jgi:hypothetical protein
MRSDIRGKVLEASGRTVQQDERRMCGIAGLDKARLQSAGVDPRLAERRIEEFGPNALVGLLHGFDSCFLNVGSVSAIGDSGGG